MHSASRWFRRLSVLGATVAALTVSLSSTPQLLLRRAAAEPVVVDDNAQRDRARELYQRGADAYQNKRYVDALASFEQGYSLTPLPGFLFNIAMTHRAMGQSEKAIASFQAYLKANPGAPDKPQVEAAIADERRKLAQASGSPDLRVVDKKGAAAAGPTSSLVSAGASSDGEGAKKPFYKTWWFWTATGVAVTAVTVGLGVGLSQSRPNSYPEVMWQ